MLKPDKSDLNYQEQLTKMEKEIAEARKVSTPDSDIVTSWGVIRASKQPPTPTK